MPNDIQKATGSYMSSNQPISHAETIARLREAEAHLHDYLNTLSPVPGMSPWARLRLWLISDPVRTKNLEKVAAHLHSISFFLAQDSHRLCNGVQESLCSLLNEIGEKEKLSYNNAWELAGRSEIVMVQVSDDDYARLLVMAETREDLRDYLKGEPNGKIKMDRARQARIHRIQQQSQEFRRDRAKTLLRQKYLMAMAVVLAVLVLGFAVAYGRVSPTNTDLVWLILSAGAVGSVLSRAIRLSRQPLNAGMAGEQSVAASSEPPLGIRSLISGWTVFMAQPVLGGTAALVVYLVFSSGFLQIAGVELQPTAYALLGFLAGYSEPFFTDIVGKTAERASNG